VAGGYISLKKWQAYSGLLALAISLCHGLLGRSTAHEGAASLPVGVDEGVGVGKEGDLSELVAAEDREPAVKDGTLTAHVEASGAARIGEVHCRGNVATAEWDDADGAADGGAETGTISLLTDTLVEVVDLDVIVDLTEGLDAEAALEHRRHVDLNTVLVDLNVGVLEHLVGLAEKTRAGVEDALDAEALLHTLIELGAVDDADSIGILSVKSRTRSRVGVGHFNYLY